MVDFAEEVRAENRAVSYFNHRACEFHGIENMSQGIPGSCMNGGREGWRRLP